MYCQNCGTQIEDGMIFCTNCGTKMEEEQSVVQPNETVVLTDNYEAPVLNDVAYQQEAPAMKSSVSFEEAIKLFFVNYTNFRGRATKSEYWWAFLFNFLVSLILGWIPIVGQLISLALIIPGLSVGIRRLHDTGKAWTYIFIELIPIVGVILLIVQYCKDSDGDNQWGPAPVNQ